jgi:hypothetical protein
MYITLSDNQRYRLNIDNIVKYCSGSDDSKATQSDITELYRQGMNELELIQKQINTTNIKNGQLKTVDTYRYDVVKGLLETFFGMGARVVGSGAIEKDVDINGNISIGESIVWNTLIGYGFLEKVN